MDYLKLRGEIGTSDLSSNIKDPSPKSDSGRRFTTGLGDAPKPFASPASTLDRPLKKFSAGHGILIEWDLEAEKPIPGAIVAQRVLPEKLPVMPPAARGEGRWRAVAAPISQAGWLQ